jgi:hypothetical protein
MLSITINVTWRTIMGALFVGATVAVSSLTIGRAEHVTPATSVYKCSSGTACLTGDSTGSKTFGVYAEGTGGWDALHAVTTTTVGNSAISGISTGTTGTGHGVYGKSSNGNGVYGTSSGAAGVYGISTASSGVYGTSSAVGTYSAFAAGVDGNSSGYEGAGISGTSTGDGGKGVFGISWEHDSYGVEGFAAGYTSAAILAVGQGAGTQAADLFEAENSSNRDEECTIDWAANLQCSGTIQGGSPMLTRQRSETGRRVLTYSAQSATPTVEDLGAAQMRDGIANVQLPADFASVMDRSNPYYVFLTPMGDTRGLYVSMQNAAGFQVRENMHGRSNVVFQYRIVAVPLDAKNVRLPNAPATKLPPLPKLPPAEH